MRDIEARIRRLERQRAAADFDPIAISRLAVEAYEGGRPFPEHLTGEARAIAGAIYTTLRFYDDMWSDEPLPIPAGNLR